MWNILGGVLLGLALLWGVLIVALRLAAPEEMRVRDALRLLPDLVRLVNRLARDPDLPRGIRIRLALLLGYLALPIDLVPDFIPVIGYADDAVIVVIVLRSVVRKAGSHKLQEHWPGTSEGLAAVYRLTRTTPDAP